MVSEVIEHELSSLGTTPISEANPCGESARYEPEFEQLEAEMSKLESLKGAPIDWQTVVKTSSEILRAKSKDLLVAVYLCQGLIQTEGYPGFAVGLKIINDLVTNYWEPMHPAVKRLRARKVAMEWLAEKASAFINSHAPTENDNDAVMQAAQLVREIDGTLADKMGGDAPGMTDLTRPLKQFREAAKHQLAKKAEAAAEQAKKQETTAEPAAVVENAAPAVERVAPQPKPAPAPAPVSKPLEEAQAVTSVESDADAKKTLRQIQDNIRKISAFYGKGKLSDSKSFRLNRIAVWLTIEQVPPNKDGLTQIPAPPTDKRKQIQALSEQSQYSSLIQEAEQIISKHAFWIDGHRLVANTLQEMGGEYAAAKTVVVNELRNFLQRLPGIIDLKFADGSSFADDATKMWVESEVMASTSESSDKPQKGSTNMYPWQAALAEAKSLVATNKLSLAVDKLHSEIERAVDIRQEFYWRTALSEILIQAGSVSVAIQMLEQMADKIEKNNLGEWEYELVIPVYQRLLEAYQKASAKKKGDTSYLSKIDDIYSKLCWLDPRIALTVKGD